jgi:tetratricopeptide (TPR) repeat protein
MRLHHSVLFCAILLLKLPAVAQEMPPGRLLLEPGGLEVARPYALEGLLWLHHQDYEAARKSFEMAQLLDPDLIAAYWGEAMLHFRPLWSQFDPMKGRAVLYKLGLKPELRIRRASVPSDQAFIVAMEALYGEDGDPAGRIERFIRVTDSLNAKSPGEELMVLQAMALVNRYRSGMAAGDLSRALAILDEVLTGNPLHPGALSAYVHACAEPSNAWRADANAAQLASIAGRSLYSMIQPAYTRLALGRWSEAEGICRKTWETSEARIKASRGNLEQRFYHALRLLHYSLMQQGRFETAGEDLRNMQRDANYSRSPNMRFHLALMWICQSTESGNWMDPAIAQAEIPVQGLSLLTRNAFLFVQGMNAVENRDMSRAEWVLLQMTDQRMLTKNEPQAQVDYYWGSPEPAETIGAERMLHGAEVFELELKAWKALREGKSDEAVDHIRQAIRLYEPLRLYAGTPVIAQCPYELHGEILMETGRPAEALEQFDLSLRNAPNRSRALHGKLRALRMLRRTEQARQVRQLLLNNWARADAGLRESLE